MTVQYVVPQRQTTAPAVVVNTVKTMSMVHGGSQASLNRGRSPPTRGKFTNEVMVATTMQSELKDLKSTLEKQHGNQQEQPDVATKQQSSDDEQHTHLERVKMALTVAPESKVRELCAMVACQQVEQEIFLRRLRTNMDTLQAQVLQASPPQETRTLKQEFPVAQDLDEWVKSNIDTETKKIWHQFEDKIFQQETELMSWLANFCASTIADTLGDEVQRQAEAIQSLDEEVTNLKEIADKSLGAWHQLLTENPMGMIGDASLESTLKNGEGTCQANKPDSMEWSKKQGKPIKRIDHKWVQRLYQELIAPSSVLLDDCSLERQSSGSSTQASTGASTTFPSALSTMTNICDSSSEKDSDGHN